MDPDLVYPAAQPSVVETSPASPQAKADASRPTSPQQRRHRPGWAPTLLRRTTLHQLRAIQKSTDPRLDLSYLSDACVRLALELGPEAVVRRAVADLLSK